MNIAAIVHNAARSFPNHPAVSQGTALRWTYKQLSRQVAVTAQNLRKYGGLTSGDRVAIVMPNQAEYFLALLAIWHAGMIAVPINAKLHPREVQYILSHSGAKLCFSSPDLFTTVSSLKEETSNLMDVINTESPAFASFFKGEPMPCAETAPEDPAWLFYTSGTTGRPKGATLTHRNLGFMVMCYLADIDMIGPGDTMLNPAPLSHGAGLYSLPHIAKGSHNVIPDSKHFDPDEIFALINHYPNVSFFAAPTMITRLINSTAAINADTTHLKTIIYGGSPMYLADLQKSLNVFGPKLFQIFGQGETPMTTTGLSKARHADENHPRYPEILASCGTPRTLVEVRVVDDQDRDLPNGEIGQILTRSDCVMAGYWNNQEATAEVLRGGWLHTGDLGCFDDEGFLTIKDRSKDMIISGGSNIYPREIEEILLQHPGVYEVSIVGRPHPDWVEEVVAFVVPRPGVTIAEEELDKLCIENIARFKRPKKYFFVDLLPKNNYGKILKIELRKRLLEDPMLQDGEEK